MFDWNDEELGNIIWGEASDGEDHIVPYPKGNEVKKLRTSVDHRKRQCIQESRPVNLADQEVSGPNGGFSGFKHWGIAQRNPNEAHPASGAEIDSWPNSPLTNVACDREYTERNSQKSIDVQLSDFGPELYKYGSAREDTTQPDDVPALFGNECEDKVDGGFLEYSWENIGSFDDLDNVFRNDVPIFGRERLGSGELWSSTTDLFSSPTKSLPACSSNLCLNAMSVPDSEMKLEFSQHGNPSHTPGFKRTDHDVSYDIDLKKNKTGGYCHYVDPGVDCIGESGKTLLEKTDTTMVATTEVWNGHSAIKTNEEGKELKNSAKEESKERSSQGLNPPWPLTGTQFLSFGNQFANSCVQTNPFSVSSQKQPVGPEPWLYWQTPYMPVTDHNPQHHYPTIPTMSKVQSDRDKHQLPRGEYGDSPESLKHANHSKGFTTPPRPSSMTPQEKVVKLKRRQQMQAMLAIQEQQQHFAHKTTQMDLYNIEKCSQENQHQDTTGSTIEVEENLKFPFTKNPTEHDDSNTVSMAIDDCSLEEKMLHQLQDIIGKLDVKVRLCVRDSLNRLAQSAMQRNTNMDTSSTNNTMQYDVLAEKDEACGHNRLARISEVETQTNPIDRTVAHLLFHQPLEQPTVSAKDVENSGSPGFTKLGSGIQSFSAGCLPESSVDNKISSPPCVESDTQGVYECQSSPLMKFDNVSEDRWE